jgi:glycerate kinase
MNKIVLAIDSFKGCLSSVAAEEAAAKGIKSVFPQCDIISVPVSDGGEGLLSSFSKGLKYRVLSVDAHDPLMNIIKTDYLLLEDESTAYIEIAKICGLALVPLSRRNPMLTSSYGVGELISDAAHRGCKHIIVGLGGSATNDAGVGMLQALGYRFYNSDRQLLHQGGEVLQHISYIECDSVPSLIDGIHFTVACDVDAPLYGESGASYVFAKQKGASPEMIVELDKGLRNFSYVINRDFGIDVAFSYGAGAAGGIGAAFRGFLNADFKSGIELVLEINHFDELISGADLVITGEGRLDKQTLMGKVPFGILSHAKKFHVPVIALSGLINDEHLLLEAGFHSLYTINPPGISLSVAMQPDYASSRIQSTVFSILSSLQK